jgi:hypothetical protein
MKAVWIDKRRGQPQKAKNDGQEAWLMVELKVLATE